MVFEFFGRVERRKSEMGPWNPRKGAEKEEEKEERERF